MRIGCIKWPAITPGVRLDCNMALILGRLGHNGACIDHRLLTRHAPSTNPQGILHGQVHFPRTSVEKKKSATWSIDGEACISRKLETMWECHVYNMKSTLRSRNAKRRQRLDGPTQKNIRILRVWHLGPFILSILRTRNSCWPACHDSFILYPGPQEI